MTLTFDTEPKLIHRYKESPNTILSTLQKIHHRYLFVYYSGLSEKMVTSGGLR